VAQMTIAVYRINGLTGKRTNVRPKQTVNAARYPELSTRWPDCACQRCVKPDDGKDG
jgi:hypothetical protein